MASASKTVRKKSDQPLKPASPPRAGHFLGAALAAALSSALALGLNQTAAAAPAPSPAVRGTTAGLLTPAPIYAVGAQVGNYGGTGLSLQRLSLPGGGAFNGNIGIESGSLGISGDYVLFASDQFHLVQLKSNSDYNSMRGQLLLWFGGGLGLQSGVWLRAPVGVQYTMLRDPVTFYGGFALAIGPFFSSNTLGPEAWLSLGMRLLL